MAAAIRSFFGSARRDVGAGGTGRGGGFLLGQLGLGFGGLGGELGGLFLLFAFFAHQAELVAFARLSAAAFSRSRAQISHLAKR